MRVNLATSSPIPRRMQAVHKTLLEVNEEFLVSEAPAAPLLQALQDKHVLTDLDLQQLHSLEAQGARAVKRFVLHVLPLRGPLAFPALLEALQEAKAQHLVDLLLEEEAVLLQAVAPIELPEPEPPKPLEDPNEYARKLRANAALIQEAVDPDHLTPLLEQNGILSPLEQRLLAEVRGQHALTWSVLWAVLMQRGPGAYTAFMAALLQKGYSALFHTIQETKVTGPEALASAMTRHTTTTAIPTTESLSVDRYGTVRTPPLHVPVSTGGPPHATTTYQSYQHPSGEESEKDVSVSRSVSQPHAGPFQPGYSLGRLDYQYTPRTSDTQAPKERSQDRPHAHPGTGDVLYSPTWTDPYNYLRRADVVSPGILSRKSYSPEAPRDESNPAVATHTGAGHDDSTAEMNANTSGESKDEVPADGLPPAVPRLDLIPEGNDSPSPTADNPDPAIETKDKDGNNGKISPVLQKEVGSDAKNKDDSAQQSPHETDQASGNTSSHSQGPADGHPDSKDRST